MTDSYKDLLCCPNCRATAQEGFKIELLVCQRCDAEFFSLDGMPCVFRSGQQQKALWEHLLAKFIEQGEAQKNTYLQSLSSWQLTPLTRQRLEAEQHTRVTRHQSVVSTLRQAGLMPRANSAFEGFNTLGYSQYYGLALRDWGWEALPEGEDNYRRYEDENALILNQCRAALQDVANPKPMRCLVLGAGAGRLSWDLHNILNTELTLAIDNNPLLAYTSHCVIKGKALPDVYETRIMPHAGIPRACRWPLVLNPKNETQVNTWSVIAADAWYLPMQYDQFDLIVTPWFMDICGKDAKRVIGLVDKLLKPGGYWLNHGPLLYPDGLPQGQQYSPEELRQLIALSKMRILNESFKTLPYSHSPYSERGRVEDCWTYLAQASPTKQHLLPAPPIEQLPNINQPAGWMVLPHLPIPDVRPLGVFPEQLRNIEQLIDGTRSISDLEECFEGKLPSDITPQQFVQGMVRDFLVEDK